MKSIPTRIAGLQLVRHRADNRLQPNLKPAQHLGANWQRHKIALAEGELSSPTFVDSSRGQQSICCISGELFVVAVDIRAGSHSFGKWQSFYMSADVTKTLAAPKGVALGWQATGPGCAFKLGQFAIAEHSARSLAWDDPELDIVWPMAPNGNPQAAADTVDLLAIEAAAACESFRFRPASTDSYIQADAPAPPSPARSHQSLIRQSSSHNKPSHNKPSHTMQISPLSNPPAITTKRASNTARSSQSPTILVVGSSGQLGHDLSRHLRSVGRVIGACRTKEQGVLPIPTFVDVSRPASIREAIRRTQPQIIVNASGMTDPIAAEADPRTAQSVNATAPAVMAEEAKKIGAGIIHFCTDKVFDGSGDRPWRETDEPHPLNQYGLTKLRGTEAIRASGIPHLVLRTGWLYSTHGKNYVQSLVDLITYRSKLQLANDCFGTPTSTDWLAQLVAGLLERGGSDPLGWMDQHSGLYNASLLGYASRLDVGDQVIATCKQHALPIVLDRLEGVPLAALNQGVPTPGNCRLDPSLLATTFQIPLPSWREELNRQLATMIGIGDASLLSIA